MLVHVFGASHFEAVPAAVNVAVRFDAVTNYVTIAVSAFGRKRVDRAFETIERMALAFGDNLESFIVIVSANFAARHGISP